MGSKDKVFDEQIPPQDLEAEQAVLGSMILDKDAIPVVQLELTGPEAFYAEKHAIIYRAITALADKGKPTDLITLQAVLKRPLTAGGAETYLGEIGGVPYLMNLTNTVPTTANVREYAKIVARKARLRSLLTAGKHIQDLAREADAHEDGDADETVSKAVAESQSTLRKVSQPQENQGLQPVKGMVAWAKERLAKMGTPDPRRIEFGLREWDSFAWLAGETLAIHAPSGNGKSTLLRALLQGAASKGSPAALFSLEMGEDQVKLCWVASDGHLSLRRLRNMDREPLHEREQTDFLEAAERIERLPLYADFVPEQRMSDIRAKALAASMKYGGLKVIGIDYAGIVGDTPEAWQRHEQMLIKIHYEAQWLAREVGALVIMVDQAPDEMLRRPDPTPTVFDFADAKGIKRAVDHAVGLVIPQNCITTGSGKNQCIPAFPVPAGDPIKYNDKRLENALMCAYTKGRFTGSGFLLPLYHEKKSGYIGNLSKRPWEAPENSSATQGPETKQLRWTTEVPPEQMDVPPF